jgi:NMD protein affecting ribosome stability and mRNA decay
MNCNCIQEVENKALEIYKNKNRYKKPVVSAEFADIALVFGKQNRTELITKTVSHIELTLEGQKKKERVNIIHTFCPMCGKRIGENA